MSLKSTNRSSANEDGYTNASFWGLDGHKNTVKRLEDGAQLCDEFTRMINERAEIEMKYTLKLRDWSKRWHDKINGKISEYGTMIEVFKAVLREAEDVAEIHVERHNRLKADLCESIKQWKNQHYHKSVLKWKEVKECESGFSKIHEPWARKYHKMDRAKKNFHRASKASEHASMQASNAEKEGSMPDKTKKIQDNSAKLRAEVEETKKKYERRLAEINSGNDVYAVEVEEEFRKWERFEKVRLTFFKDALERYHNVLDLSEDERLNKIYQSFVSKIRVADSTKDLKWWSAHYGPGMPKKWPEFEEYDPNRSPNAKGYVIADGGDLPDDIDEPAVGDIDGVVEDGTRTHEEGGPGYNPFDEDDNDGEVEENSPVIDTKVNGQIENTAASNEEPKEAVEDIPGVPVRAKYDYEASEDDELSFKVGDVITQLSSEDGQGWCKGELNGVEGLFPAKWVESA